MAVAAAAASWGQLTLTLLLSPHAARHTTAPPLSRADVEDRLQLAASTAAPSAASRLMRRAHLLLLLSTQTHAHAPAMARGGTHTFWDGTFFDHK